MNRNLSDNIKGLDLAKWHSCLKMGRAFRACPLALAAMESLRSRDRQSDSEDERPDDPNPPRTQTVPSQALLDTALVRLIEGFKNPVRNPLSPKVPNPTPGKERVPERLLNGGFIEEIWRSVISDPVELLSGNAGVLLGPVNDLLKSKSPEEALITALRIGESFIGKLLQTGFKPSTSPSGVSSSPTVTPSTPKKGRSLVKDVAGGAVAGAAAVGAGVLFKSGRGGRGGVSQPFPRGGGGKFFEAGRKFPILQPR